MSGRFFLSGTVPLFEGVPQPLSTFTFELIGTSSAQDTYSDSGLTSANTNPVVTDAYGYLGEVFFSRNRYKVTWKNAAGTTLKTWAAVDKDKIHTKGAGFPSDPHPGQIHDNTSDGHRYEYKINSASWLDLGTTDSVANTASVTEALTGTDATKFMTPDAAAAIWQRGANITPAGAVATLPSGGGGVFTVAAGNFAGISSAIGGRQVIFEFAGVSVITHDNTALNLPGAANITTAAGDRAKFVNSAANDAAGANWKCEWFTKATGSPVNLADFTAAQSDVETGSSASLLVPAGRLKYGVGSAKAWLDYNGASGPTVLASENVSSVTDVAGTGEWTINFSQAFSSTSYGFALGGGDGTGTGQIIAFQSNATPTASAFRLSTAAAGGAANNATRLGASFHGDQ